MLICIHRKEREMTKKEYYKKIVMDTVTSTPQTIKEISNKCNVNPQIVAYFCHSCSNISCISIRKKRLLINHYFIKN